MRTIAEIAEKFLDLSARMLETALALQYAAQAWPAAAHTDKTLNSLDSLLWAARRRTDRLGSARAVGEKAAASSPRRRTRSRVVGPAAPARPACLIHSPRGRAASSRKDVGPCGGRRPAPTDLAP